jgi:glyoxylase-like metal-dependent hydrolase (beta-lactamase superfamily II)
MRLIVAESKDATPLAKLVNAGANQREAIAITDFIFMSQDVSNSYLVTTGDGDVLVNAGTTGGGPRHKSIFDKVRTGPLRRIILTQSHEDHFGGVVALREPDTKTIAQALFPETRAYYRKLVPFFAPRVAKLWAAVLAKGALGNTHQPQEVDPDILVDDLLTFELGGRRFEIISTPGGETLDSLCVWMPDEGVVFTGNLFGPVFLSQPFLCTVRGDKPRSVNRYLRSLERVRALGAEILITGHGEPVRGADRIRGDLDRMHAAVSYVNEATMAGMNAGKDVHTLMREIRVPDEIAIGEFHGKVSWNVRSIWEEYAGWFHYDSTTSLYAEPQRNVHADLAELAGGADKLVQRARAKLAAQKPLDAIHLLDIALHVDPENSAGLQVKLEALKTLEKGHGGTNLSETMWLRSEMAATGKLLEAIT